ncbi:MAG: DUF3047 domain-containing protein [Proteobacteria bacterium]|nr:DUF3047 domain-containing protein [Pseudomonadota bacterium]MBU1688846.1 DUF3047 domain-containing protein [Pseudomonadota bacterium]
MKMSMFHTIPWATLLTVLFQATTSSATGDSLLIDDFKKGIGPGWEEKSFKGKTLYSPSIADGIPCLQAKAKGTASGLFYKIDLDPAEYPILSWEWKVDNILAKGDARTKAGDDYSARIYVVFPSFLFWKTRALNYVWANQLPKDSAIPNSFTANAMMIAVESGREQIGQWRKESRNIYEDYQRYFGSPPPKVGAIAIMTDTDNTGESATACYGPIRLNRHP